MPAFFENFDQGLSKQNFAYQTDAANGYIITSRKGFQPISQLQTSTSTPNAPVHFRARYLHLQGVNAINGKLSKRKVPCDSLAILSYFNALQQGTGGTPQVTLDGQAFKVMGYTGEYYHKSRG